jgi:hypothetical protein
MQVTIIVGLAAVLVIRKSVSSYSYMVECCGRGVSKRGVVRIAGGGLGKDMGGEGLCMSLIHCLSIPA